MRIRVMLACLAREYSNHRDRDSRHRPSSGRHVGLAGRSVAKQFALLSYASAHT